MMVDLCKHHDPEAALLLGTLFFTYGRPSEVLALTPMQIVAGRPGERGVALFATVIFHPFEYLRAGKTGEFDHSVAVAAPPDHRGAAAGVGALPPPPAGQVVGPRVPHVGPRVREKLGSHRGQMFVQYALLRTRRPHFVRDTTTRKSEVSTFCP